MSSERFSKGPAHLRVRDLLAQKIAAGEWDAGKELPSASVLARQLGVSCRTIRSALELLERECAVVRKLGGGTFVAAGDVDQRTIRIGDPGSDSSEASEIHLGTLVEGWADEAECARLDLRASDRVYRIRRTRYAMGMLFMAERTTLMAALFPGLADRAFPAHGILDLARLYGFRLGIVTGSWDVTDNGLEYVVEGDHAKQPAVFIDDQRFMNAGFFDQLQHLQRGHTVRDEQRRY